MIVYRIAKKEYNSLDGKGASYHPGRWNEEGIPALYTSATPSLAILEVMVNVDDWRIFVAKQWVLLEIEIPVKGFKDLSYKQLPKHWDDSNVSLETQKLGTTFLKNISLPGFSVPSAISRLEKNYIINPRYERFSGEVKLVKSSDFVIDARLVK